MNDMARHYRRCRDCGVDRELLPLSKRGLCARCATARSLRAAAYCAAISAAVQVKVPSQSELQEVLCPPPTSTSS